MRLLTILCSVVLLSAVASGQTQNSQPATPSNNDTQQTQMRGVIPPQIAALNLSEKQRRRLEPVYEEHYRQVNALRQDTALTPEAKKARLDQSCQTISRALGSVLNSKQKKQFAELRRGGAVPQT